MKRKSLFTLIETLIATALAAVLLSTLTFFYHYIDTLNRKIEKEKQEVFAEAFLEHRLFSIFPKIAPFKTKKKTFYFSGDEQSILFSFNNGKSLRSAFSGQVFAKIYLTKQKQLVLQVWPNLNSSAEESHLEVLAEKVEKVEWEFYYPGRGKPTEKLPPAGWSRHWGLQYEAVPSMMRLILNSKREYLFPIPHAAEGVQL